METTPLLEKKRYHDLDALRAVAMLLGILLHGAISFMREPFWPIQDSQSLFWGMPEGMQEVGASMGMELPKQFSPYKFFFMQLVHGFRMPLFFVASGFFAAMLWRQRGMKEMLKHRTKRVLLPLFATGIVIIPAFWLAMVGGGYLASRGGGASGSEAAGLWAAAERDDVNGIYAALEAGTDVNATRKDGQTALNLAVFNHRHKAAHVLLEKGADVNSRNGDDRTTPLHTATFVADVEMVRLLLAKGADPFAKNKRGETPLAVVSGEWNEGLKLVYKFIGGLTQREFDLERIQRDRVRVRELLSSKTTATRQEDKESPRKSDQKDEWNLKDVWNLPGGKFLQEYYETLPGWMKPVVWVVGGVTVAVWVGSMIPLFHHLWFLFYLMLVILLFALAMWFAKKMKLRAWTSWTMTAPNCFLWLLPLTFLAQVTMWQSFGPDTHMGPIPWPPKVFYYCIFFGFGALCYGRPEYEEKLGRHWPVSFLLAIPVVLVGVGFLESRNVQISTQLSQGNFSPIITSHLIASGCMVLYCWLMIFACIGLFRYFFSSGNKIIRYLSDSAYWLYIAHMPLIILLQGWVAPWEVHSLIKFLLVFGVTVGVLLVMYETMIRYTWIGKLLNGPRQRAGTLPPVLEAGSSSQL